MEKILRNDQPRAQPVDDDAQPTTLATQAITQTAAQTATQPKRPWLQQVGAPVGWLLSTGARTLLWLYSGVVPALWLWHQWAGDRLWWLALLSSVTPHFFWPLLLLWPLALWQGRRRDYLLLSLPTLLFLYLYGALFLPNRPPAYQTEPRPLRVMSFNMWTGARDAKTARVIIDEGLPDIVALQEVSYGMQYRIEQSIGNYFPYQSFDYSGRGGLAVLSRYPLERLTSDMLIDLFCSQFRVTVDATHQFRLYNCHPYSTHFSYNTEEWPAMVPQVEETFRLRTLLGERLAQEIRRHGEATIVLGDFNSTDQSDAYRHLTSVLSDAQRTSGWGFGHTFPAGTAIFRRPPILPRLVRIDLILYSSAFAALQATVGSTYGRSDHLPVRAVLAWRAQP
jgi:endonuclease/exonuclease/phosphatase family metal-dependent hydrolase